MPFIDEQVRSTGRRRLRMEAGALVVGVCETLGVAVEEVTGSSEVRRVVRARELIAVLAVERYGVQAKQVAAMLGKGADTVSRCLARGSRRRWAEVEFGATLERVDGVLAASRAAADGPEG